MMIYSIQLLPVAQQDLIDNARYISQTLDNPAAASHLEEQIEQTLERLSRFPYSNTVYHPIMPLEREISQGGGWELSALLLGR